MATGFGYLAPLPARLLVSAELEAALYRSDPIRGFLREGAGFGDREVRLGGWTFAKNARLGVNARFGFGQGVLGPLGDGGSVCLITGVHRLGATIGEDFESGVRSESTTAEHLLRPRSLGGGIEWGARSSRLPIEVPHAAHGLDFRDPDSADGSALDSPRLDHSFDLNERCVSVGVVAAL